MGFPELMRRVKAAKARYPTAHIIVEDSASGISLRQQLQADGLGAIAAQSTEDKVVCAHRITPILEADRIFVPARAPWLDELINELAAFPGNGTHNDQVDSFCQAINWWEQRKLRRRRPPSGAIEALPCAREAPPRRCRFGIDRCGLRSCIAPACRAGICPHAGRVR